MEGEEEEIMWIRIAHYLRDYPDRSYQKVGEVFGCSRQRVYQVAKRAQIRRTEESSYYRKDVPITRVLSLYNRNLFIKDIAEVFSCDVRTIYSRLDKAGVFKNKRQLRSMRILGTLRRNGENNVLRERSKW